MTDYVNYLTCGYIENLNIPYEVKPCCEFTINIVFVVTPHSSFNINIV